MERYTSLKELLDQNKGDILRETMSRLKILPQSPYYDFLVRTDEGQRRFRIWMNLVIGSLQDEQGRESFFVDTERVGYARAVDGFNVEDVFQLYRVFHEVFWEILQEAMAANKISLLNNYREVSELTQILFRAASIIASSFLRTREEMITEKVSHLQKLYSFTQEIVTTFNLEEIADHILRKVASFFGVEAGTLVIYRGQRVQEVYGHPTGKEVSAVMPVVEKTLTEGIPLFVDEAGDIYREIDHFDLKRMVSVPIQVHRHCYGILTLYNESRGFKFTSKEIELLYQFIYIMGVALENAFMLEEIEQGRQELRLLTNKMISLQEEERRRLAEDIHDTLAQTLTGIGYKVQVCKELLKKNPELLLGQFDSLIENINHAIDQSREIISSLRPDLIDTMGLVPALQRHIDNFAQETSIKVITHLPKRVKLSSEISISLFRVAQEALMNVYKHAEVKMAEITLTNDDQNIILVVADNGKGFDVSRGTFRKKGQSTLGLLSMKERLKAMGGTLTIKAEINRGCRIEAKIPLSDEVGHRGKPS